MISKQKNMTSFKNTLIKHDIPLTRSDFTTLQINLGKLCNQMCSHCHVGAGPHSTEIMGKDTIDRILELLKNDKTIEIVDITGGAPEMNPNFKYAVSKIRQMNKHIICRSNLTVLLEESQEGTADFLASNNVEIIASLPCYLEENVDAQRGTNVYEKSIKALKILNDLGYGNPGSNLKLSLVFNSAGASLPPNQASLEADYKSKMKANHNISFHKLLTITNMPIKRFKEFLDSEGKYEYYFDLLVKNFNPAAAGNIMCKDLLSIGWDGKIYNCDFNQALEMTINEDFKTIWNVDQFQDVSKDISFASHCFGCTAGSGSSCKGSLV